MRKKLYFRPFIDQLVKKDQEEKKAMTTIQKTGIMSLTGIVCKKLGYDIVDKNTVIVKLFIDEGSRAIGFKFLNNSINVESLKKEEGYRILTVSKYTSRGNGLCKINLQVKHLLNQIGNFDLPMKLEIDQYDDKDENTSIGKINYVVIPKLK